jgi:hypothetical protein
VHWPYPASILSRARNHSFRFEGIAKTICKKTAARRAAIGPVIGHLKAEHHMGRNYLAHLAGDAVNALLADAGYNLHLLLRWLEPLLSKIPGGSESSGRPSTGLKIKNFTDDERASFAASNMPAPIRTMLTGS